MNTSTYKKLAYSGMAAATMLVSPSALPRYHGFQKNRKAVVSEYVGQSSDTIFQEIGSSSKYERFQEEATDSNTVMVADAIQYNTTSFCYDKDAYLNFYEPFQLKFDNGDVTLLPHAISFTCKNISEFDNALVSFIQRLLRKADQGTLDNTERKTWLTLLKLFDYKQFSLDLAPALYEEFKITSVNLHGSLVFLERRDGKKNKCSIELSPAFYNGRFKKGDIFGAWVKRDHLDNIIKIDQPTLIEDELVTEEEWNQISVI
jgi:hypothetical protein